MGNPNTKYSEKEYGVVLFKGTGGPRKQTDSSVVMRTGWD